VALGNGITSKGHPRTRRGLAFAVLQLLCGVLLLSLFCWWLYPARAQTPQATPNQPVRPNEGATPGGPNANLPGRSPELQCQGCHAPGGNLPYLAGSKFHTGAHADYDRSFHAQGVHNGTKAATCRDCHTRNGDLSTMLPASDPNSTINRATIAETCGKCHGDKSVMQGSGISNRPLLSYRESVHAKAIARGNMSAAVCTDCHNSHDVQPASNGQSSIAKVNIASTCGKCHQMESGEFVQSVHGQAVARGVSRSPVCTDCHGIHNIEPPVERATATASAAIATESCARCHEGVTLTKEFGVAGERVSSYRDSYHGLASRMGSKVVANCASCHGVHNILPSSDPKSMISANNLPQTCGQCHIGAGANFARGKIHLTAGLVSQVGITDAGTIGTRIVRWIYIPLIILVIGGMAVHNGLIWVRKAARKKRQARQIVRLTGNQRVQHWLLLTSFITLVLSGFALQYPDSWLAWLLGGSEYLRRIIHRIAAVIMLVVGIYHLAYLFWSKDGRLWVKDMMIRGKDFKDVIGNFGYYFGVSKSRPKIARFGYAEKAEYWAVVWGTLVMGLTGLMIWFKLGIFSFLPRWAIDIALAVHFYEAVLATLAIVVWHFYHVIFDPDVYPVNFAFLDGRVSEEHYREEHQLAYEESLKEDSEEAQATPEPEGPQKPLEAQ
jgi:formate dehydrogenase gamma subunit